MPKPYLSVVIPTYNRHGLLQWHLRELCNQSLSRDEFEVIVVDDCSTDPAYEKVSSLSMPYSLRVFRTEQNSGPATARNLGVEKANGEKILFVGDDTIPHKHLLYRHWLEHKNRPEPCAIQGFTDWHPYLPPDTFHAMLHAGPQASWNNLKDANGNWMERDQSLTGWFLTTNCSIDREMFVRVGSFLPDLKEAAWEDILFALMLNQWGGKCYLEPEAINYHYHRQSLDGFVARQIKEGFWRPVLCREYIHVSSQMLDTPGLRDTNVDMLTAAVEVARGLHYNENPAVQEARWQAWQTAFRYASLEGIRRGLAARTKICPIWQAIPHLHLNDAIIHTVGACASYEKKDYVAAFVSSEWARNAEPQAWCMPAIQGEIVLAQSKVSEAIDYFRKSVAMSAGEKWPLERLVELTQ